MTKSGVSPPRATERGLAVAAKPDSQDVCFIASRTPGEGRGTFLAGRIDLHPGEVVDLTGHRLGEVPAVELVTLGQRRGLGVDGTGERLFAVEVDVPARRVTVGRPSDLLVDEVALVNRTWTNRPLREGSPVEVQISAHGSTVPGTISTGGVRYAGPSRRVAPGQVVACYLADVVVGSGVAA